MRLARLSPVLALLLIPSSATAKPGDKEDPSLPALDATAYLYHPKAARACFCVHPTGLFVGVHPSAAAGDEVKLTLNFQRPGQKIVAAKVVSRDPETGLTLILTDEAGEFPALELADAPADELPNLRKVGFPIDMMAFPQRAGDPEKANPSPAGRLGVIPVRGSKGAIGISIGSSPSTSGGCPLFDGKNRAVGVTGLPDAMGGVTNAIPAARIKELLLRPVVRLDAARITPQNAKAEATFRVRVLMFNPEEKPEVELVIGEGATARKFPMKRGEAEFVAKAIPLPGGVPSTKLRIEAKFADGSLVGFAPDGPAGPGFLWSELVAWKAGEASLASGKSVKVAASALKPPLLEVGGKPAAVDLSGVEELSCASTAEPLSLRIAAVARLKQSEGRAETVVELGSRPGTIDDLKSGRFRTPGRSTQRVTALRIGSIVARPEVQTHAPAAFDTLMAGNQIVAKVRGNPSQFQTTTVTLSFPMESKPGVREYGDPSGKASPVSVSGVASDVSLPTGRFRVWEFDSEGDRVTKAAIDFVWLDATGRVRIYGQIRVNSSYD